MIPRRVLASLILALTAPGSAWAQGGSTNAAVPGTLELYPNLNAIGARLPVTGDANGNASAHLEWKPSGSSTWSPGMAMTRITNGRFAASVMWLDPATSYDVRAIVDDPDGGGTVSATARTRGEPITTASGRTWWVALNGSDAAAGTSTAPLQTLQAAAQAANPGDEIRVKPGLYYQSIDAVRAGTAQAPIHLVADAPGVILDGSDPAYLSRTDWANETGGVWSVPYTGTTRLVAADSLQRLYHHATVADLRAGTGGVNQGWTVLAGRLYVRLEDGSSPVGHKIHVARYDDGVVLDVSYWRVSGLEIRNFGMTSAGSGVYIRAANGCVVSENHIHTIGGKCVYLRVGSSDCLIEKNLLRDPRIGTWPWSATKAHEEEQQAVSNRGGRGVVIRQNSIHGTFDGIDVAGGESDENVGADCDVDDNSISGTTDDALEPETISGINVRVWKNRIDDVFSGMSMAPVYQGPMYVLYNTFTNYRRGGFKFSLSGVGQIWICHNTLASNVAGASTVHPSGPYSNVHFRNNVLVGNATGAVSDDAGESQTGNDFDGDVIHATSGSVLFRWHGVDYPTLAALQAGTTFEIFGHAGDPLFLSPQNGDYTLSPASPAIDAALRLPGINDRYAGAAADCGAWEFGGPDRTPPAAVQDLKADH